MPRTCIFGCLPATRGILHTFPNQERFPEQFKAWIDLVPESKHPSDNDFHSKRVCDRHFTARDRNRCNRLNAVAVPTLYLPYGARISPISKEVAKYETQSSWDIQHATTSKAAFGVPVNEFVTNSCQLPVCLDNDRSSFNVALDHNNCVTQTRDVALDHNYCVTSTRNVALDHNYCVTSTRNVALEHNYCVTQTRHIKASKKVQLYQADTKNLRREIYRLRSKGKSLKTRLEDAENLYDKSAFQKVIKTMTLAAQTFTAMQMQTAKHKQGRRFTIKEKILSLSLYKKSPKCYSLMSKMFTLPSEKSLKRLLAEVQICPGTNNKLVFENLKKKVADLSLPDRLCSLIFDEMYITPQIHYDSSMDKMKGFVTHGKKNIANHALVFMVKGIQKQYKQPVAYYFTNSLNKYELKNIIIDVITKVQETGLVILCTVCDQSTVNVSAINELMDETKKKCLKKNLEYRNNYFKIAMQKVIPLFDTPHLLKGLRNNLLSKNLIYTDYNDENKVKTVKWEYFHQLYLADESFGELRLLQKLTEEHVVPEKIKKMRIKIAAQVFSRSVAVAAEHLTARGRLPRECRDLIPFVLTVDNIFDSLNVNSFTIPNGKIYKGPVKIKSPHHELWVNALKMFRSIKFEKQDKYSKITEIVPPTIKNFIRTIEGFQELFKILTKKYSFSEVLTRNINQDPVENFFGNIRSYGVRNIAPNSIAFERAYKSLLLNNYNSPQSHNANCENDRNVCLQNMEFFFKKIEPPSTNTPQETNIPIVCFDFQYNDKISDQGQCDYVCGWVLKKCLTNIVKSCKKCKSNIICTQNDVTQNAFIRAKEYFKNKKALCYPSIKLKKCFKEVQYICVTLLKKDVPTQGLKYNVKMFCNIYVEFPFECDHHKEELKTYFLNISCNIIIYSWCKTINRILCGKITWKDDDDEIKKLASDYYNKHKHNK